MKQILFFFFLPLYVIYGQGRDKIFRIAYDNKDAVGYSYNVDVLTLGENKQYVLLNQKYSSRKKARKNIPYRVLKTYGTWKINNDTLSLVDDEHKKETFFIMKHKQLFYIFYDQVSKFPWKWVSN